MKWFEILGNIDLPNSYEGYLDWTTGVLRINNSFDEWEQVRARMNNGFNAAQDTPLQRKLGETMAHENIHYIQICITGFLYQLVIDLNRGINIALEEHDLNEKLASPEGIKDLLLDLENISQEAQEILNHCVGEFIKKGRKGISVRSIAESAAVLIQKRMNWRGLKHRDYIPMLDPLPKEYRAAYELCVDFLGEEAFSSFPIISFLSLCTRSPAEAFVSLCEEAQRKNIYLRGLDTQPFAEMLMGVSNDIIGGSVEVSERSSSQHPIYYGTMTRLNELAYQDKFNVRDFMAAPHMISNDIANACVTPFLFNSEDGKYPLYLPDNLNWPEVEKQERVDMLLMQFALSRKILGNISPPP